MTTDIDYLLAPVCAITILILSLWLSQNLPAPFQSFSGVGRKLPLLRVTSSIGWLCGGCSLGWGYCTGRLDLDDLQAPTVAAKALGPTLHVENFSELIWKFEIWTNKDSQDYPFWFCDMGLVPTLGCTLGCTLFHFATKTSPQERFRTVQNGSELLWGCLRMVFGHVWTSFWEFFVCLLLSKMIFAASIHLGRTWRGRTLQHKKTAVKSELGIEPFQGFVQRINWIVIVMFTFINIRLLFYDLHSVRRFSLLRHFLI
jgi:hypothetical protein